MRYTPVSQLVTRRWRATRTAVVLTATALFFSVSIQPATAADGTGIDRCTTVDFFRPVMGLISGNVLNPIREWGWWVVGILLVIAFVIGMFSGRENPFWKRAAIGVVLVAGVLALFGAGGAFNLESSGSSNC